MPCERLPFGTHGTITLTNTKAGTWQAFTYYRGLYGVRRRLRRTASTRTRVEIALREYATDITYFERMRRAGSAQPVLDTRKPLSESDEGLSYETYLCSCHKFPNKERNM